LALGTGTQILHPSAASTASVAAVAGADCLRAFAGSSGPAMLVHFDAYDLFWLLLLLRYN
jgi:hypothetical protein